ncbi:MAG TPA: 50S ribosomal protein L17 [Ignavibacteriaceae bacterium]|nr:50S ribosomal protein L17 [Ignavibacteriaceae bacterium]
MRHRVRGRKLKRTASHRDALMRSLATSLLKHKRIKTTVAKAKETRGFVEALITKAKKNDLAAKKHIMQFIKDKATVKELFSEIITKVGDRPGGYTRVVKLGNRMGDAAQMAIIELVDYNDVVTARQEEQKEKREAKVKTKKEAKEKEVEEAKVLSESAEK